jgi:hypothetical protein
VFPGIKPEFPEYTERIIWVGMKLLYLMKTNPANIKAALSMAGLLASLSPFAVASEPVEAAVIRIADGVRLHETITKP